MTAHVEVEAAVRCLVEVVDVVVDGPVGALKGAEVLAVNVADEIDLRHGARTVSRCLENAVEDVAREQVEGAAEECEGTGRHALNLEPQQLRVAARKGAVVVLELGDGITHRGSLLPTLPSPRGGGGLGGGIGIQVARRFTLMLPGYALPVTSFPCAAPRPV